MGARRIGGGWFSFCLQLLVLGHKFGKHSKREQAVVTKLAKESIINAFKSCWELLAASSICLTRENFWFWQVGGMTAHQRICRNWYFIIFYCNQNKTVNQPVIFFFYSKMALQPVSCAVKLLVAKVFMMKIPRTFLTVSP